MSAQLFSFGLFIFSPQASSTRSQLQVCWAVCVQVEGLPPFQGFPLGSPPHPQEQFTSQPRGRQQSLETVHSTPQCLTRTQWVRSKCW